MSNKRFFLPKAVYEILPLFYILIGVAALLHSHHIALDVLAAWLIARGLFTSLLRFNYRSPRQALSKSPVKRREK